MKDGSELGNYMLKQHGMKDQFWFNLDNKVEEIACMAWDAALGRNLSTNSPELFEINVLIEAALTVQRLVSSARSALYVSQRNYTKIYNSNDNQKCVIERQGICGNHQSIIAEVLDILEINSRPVGIYYEDKRLGRQNHAATEAFIGGKWRFVDTTWGSAWLSDPNNAETMLSFEEISSLSEDDRKRFHICNQMDSWYRFQLEWNINPFAYLSPKKYLGIVKGDGGYVNYERREEGLPVLEHIPKYLGATTADGIGIAGRLGDDDLPKDCELQMELDVRSFGGLKGPSVMLRNEFGDEVSVSIGLNRLNVRNGATWSVVREPGTRGFVVFNRVEFAG